MLSDYAPILVLFALVGLVVVAILLISTYAGPKNPNRHKEEPFECGGEPIGSARSRFSVKFYTIAILFILFDIETVFIVPWAVLFRELGVVGLIEMVTFVGILAAGLAYVWKKGGLEWE